MRQIFGLYIPDKEDRKRKEEETLYRYFPYGKEHREKIGNLLEELIPGEKRQDLLMYYIQIKEKMMGDSSRSFEDAIGQIKRNHIIISVNDKVNRYYKAVIETDACIDETLQLPNADAIREKVGGTV